MDLARKAYRFLKRRVLGNLFKAVDCRLARRKLLSRDDAISEKEKALLGSVSLALHRKDGMYVFPGARHYLLVGLSALRCIEEALEKADRNEDVRSILDFACGHGRVLRFLKARFPEAEITGSELDTAALSFCERAFTVKTVASDTDFSKLSLSGKFDLIWCGSLLTHIDEAAAIELLRFFHNHLSPTGLCIFSTHGQFAVERMQAGTKTYGLTSGAQQTLISGFHETGYGYADYAGQTRYGISVVSRGRIQAMARSVGQWRELLYLERGWDRHHDVFAFAAS